MAQETYGAESVKDTLSIYDKLLAAFGELGENVPLVIASLPHDVEAALSSADDEEVIREIWFTYLERETSYRRGPDREEVSDFQRLHGHRYARDTEAILSSRA